MVAIGGHDVAKVEDINECMDSLFDLVSESVKMVNTGAKKTVSIFYLPVVAHYYVLYIHPYIDYNGRIARMVSLWITMLLKTELFSPMYISEAINDDKNEYYLAIDNTRNSNNDLTYFLQYIINLSNKYYLVYKNLYEIRNNMALNGETLTNTEQYYLKKIIVNCKRGWFNYKGFIEFAN